MILISTVQLSLAVIEPPLHLDLEEGGSKMVILEVPVEIAFPGKLADMMLGLVMLSDLAVDWLRNLSGRAETDARHTKAMATSFVRESIGL